MAIVSQFSVRVVLRVWALAAVVLAAGCTGLPVTTDYDPEQNFADFKRYAWLDDPNREVKDPLVENDLMAQRIRRAADASLAARGFQKVAPAQADFLLTYYVSSETRMDIDTFHSNFGYYPCWGCVGPYYGFGYDRDINVRQYKSGSFMLDMIDPETKRLVWRGIVERRLNQGSPGERDQFVTEIIDAILARFPPPVQ